MVVWLDGHNSFGNWPSSAWFRESDAHSLEIGLVNNMPCGALQATEQQFFAQLRAPDVGMVIRLSLYAIPTVPRTEAGQRHVETFYSDINTLWDKHLDGLIVTGTEPRNSNLKHEPYWRDLARLVDWADGHTHSTIWSCLAAHSALLHSDGIERQPLPEKRFGVFPCTKVSDNMLMTCVPARTCMPHSRWNEVLERDLKAYGYRVLTHGEHAGADIFAKHRKSLSIFFQGHPEYEAETLLYEYRRDITRFLRSERNDYPAAPFGYFDESTSDALIEFQNKALAFRRVELLKEFPTALLASSVRNTWSSTAISIFRNWLYFLSAQKARWLRSRHRKEWKTFTTRARQQETHAAKTLAADARTTFPIQRDDITRPAKCTD